MKKIGLICLALIAALALSGCGLTIVSSYDHAEHYTVGGGTVTQSVNSLEINWIDGKVTIAYHDQDTVLIEETSRRALGAKEQVRWLAENGTLRIQYAQSGASIASGLKKALTVTLPRGTVLRQADISSISGGIEAPSLCADTIRLTNVSGAVYLSGAADQLTVSTVSGGIRVETAATSAEVSTTSGGISVTMEGGKTLRVKTVSGGVSLQAGAVDSVQASTVSGGVAVCLPKDSGFTATADTVSGTVKAGQDIRTVGGRYLCGEEKTSVEISTVSGGIALSVLD